MTLSIEQLLNNRYKIKALLGSGGFGAVYRAFDVNLNNKLVAIKENQKDFTSNQKQFEQEAHILANLSHPNLPAVTDYFIYDKNQYLVMEFVDGEDLEGVLKKHGAIPEPLVLAWVVQICNALAYLHGQPTPIIHRDIKPANIHLQLDGQVKLVDFGLAKTHRISHQTSAGARGYTDGYSPPEQYDDGPTDNRSDIYALGATIYHLLTNQIPPKSVGRVSGTRLTRPTQLNPNISSKIEQVITTALHLVMARRFQSVHQLSEALPPLPPSDTYHQLGDTYHQQDNFRFALYFYNESIRHADAPELEIYKKRAKIYYAFKNYNQAITDYNQIFNLTVGDAELYTDRADAYRDKGDHHQAIKDYNTAIKLDVNYASAYHGRGLAYQNQEKYDEALQDYNKALELDSKYVGVFIDRGRTYWNKKDYNQAIADLTQAIELNPKSFVAYTNRGWVYLEQYEELEQDNAYLEKAIADCTQAIQINSRMTFAYLVRARAYQKQKAYDEALANVTLIIDLDMDVVVIGYKVRGEIYYAMEDYKKAIDNLSIAIGIDSNNDDSYYFRGLAYNAIDNFNQAIEDFTIAIQLNPNKYEYYLWRGVAFKGKIQYKEAITDFTQAMQFILSTTQRGLSYNLRGESYLKNNDFNKAIEDFTIAIYLGFDLARDYGFRGLAYYLKEDYQESIENFSHAIEFNSNDDKNYFFRGLSYLESNQHDKAEIDLNRVLELSYDAELKRMAREYLSKLGK